MEYYRILSTIYPIEGKVTSWLIVLSDNNVIPRECCSMVKNHRLWVTLEYTVYIVYIYIIVIQCISMIRTMVLTLTPCSPPQTVVSSFPTFFSFKEALHANDGLIGLLPLLSHSISCTVLHGRVLKKPWTTWVRVASQRLGNATLTIRKVFLMSPCPSQLLYKEEKRIERKNLFYI